MAVANLLRACTGVSPVSGLELLVMFKPSSSFKLKGNKSTPGTPAGQETSEAHHGCITAGQPAGADPSPLFSPNRVRSGPEAHPCRRLIFHPATTSVALRSW